MVLRYITIKHTCLLRQSASPVDVSLTGDISVDSTTDTTASAVDVSPGVDVCPDAATDTPNSAFD